MKKIKFYTILILLLAGCSKDADEVVETNEVVNNDNNNNNTQTEVIDELKIEINDFIWEGLNFWYYWQENVPNLADTKTNDADAYFDFLNRYGPEDFFESLLHPDDRFSWIMDDYDVLEQSLDGVVTENGMEFGLFLECNNEDVFGWVKYVQKDSDAEAKGIERGMFFNEINNVRMNRNNYRNLLFGDSKSYTVGLSLIEFTDTNGCVTMYSTGDSYALNESKLVQDPIYIHDIIETGGKKIAYLMYNQFVGYVESEGIDHNYELMDLFAEFKNNNVDELVLDLRYNPGGGSTTQTLLASLITGQFNGEVYSERVFNSKVTAAYADTDFKTRFFASYDDQVFQSLNLNKLYVLTTGSTASASEGLINNLSAYIDVIQIGDVTVGKNQGSITVKDYIDNDGNVNPNHKYAMQPIVTKSGNSAGFADFDNGLTPDIEILERLNNLGVLGDPDERLLKTAIDHILGNITSISRSSNLNDSFGRELINFSELKKQFLIIDDIEIDFN